MAERKPVVLVGGQLQELPAGDTLPSQAPAAHGHAISNVSGLQTALDGKLDKTGGTLTGNLTGKYFTGTWLQTT